MTHLFDSELASEVGLDAAVLLTALARHHAFLKAEGDGRLVSDADGRTWSRHTQAGLSRLFPWWTPKQVRRVLDKATDDGLLVKGALSDDPFDKASWLAFADENRFVDALLTFSTEDRPSPQTVGRLHLPKWADRSAQTGTSGETEGEVIPVNPCETTSAQMGTSSGPNGQIGDAKSESGDYGIVKSYKEQIGTTQISTGNTNTRDLGLAPDAEAPASPEAPCPASGEAVRESVDSAPAKRTSGGSSSKRRGKRTFGDDTWQFKAAMKSIRVLHKHGVLDRTVEAKGSKRTAAAWADTFDKLHRLDGYTRSDIYDVLCWLDDPDNWWIQSGALQSFSNRIRQSKDEAPSKFSLMFVKMQKQTGTHATQTLEAKAERRRLGSFE